MTPIARRFSIDEYHRVLDAGALRRQARTELLGGVIIDERARTERRLTVRSPMRSRLDQATPAGFVLRADDPLTLSSDTELVPDFSVVPLDAVRRALRHPATATLAIEVTDGDDAWKTLRLPAYALAEVAEVWRIEALERRVDVFWKPSQGRYHDALTLETPAMLASRVLPAITLPFSWP